MAVVFQVARERPVLATLEPRTLGAERGLKAVGLAQPRRKRKQGTVAERSRKTENQCESKLSSAIFSLKCFGNYISQGLKMNNEFKGTVKCSL